MSPWPNTVIVRMRLFDRRLRATSTGTSGTMTPSQRARDVAHGWAPRMMPTMNARPNRTISVTRRLRGELVNQGWMRPRRAACSNPGHGELT